MFGYHVADPERYGVVDFDAEGQVRAIVEKPEVPPSNYAVTGLYFLDGTAPARAREVKPSPRGELEITSLLEMYLAEGKLRVQKMGRVMRGWTPAPCEPAGRRQLRPDAGGTTGASVRSPDEIAFRQGWIGADELAARAKLFGKNAYGRYLGDLLGHGRG